jgi:hypothetical protein
MDPLALIEKDCCTAGVRRPILFPWLSASTRTFPICFHQTFVENHHNFLKTTVRPEPAEHAGQHDGHLNCEYIQNEGWHFKIIYIFSKNHEQSENDDATSNFQDAGIDLSS